MRFRPRPYQEVAVESALRRFRAGHRSLLLHLPTGAGKTVIAALLLERLRRHRRGFKTLFLAHRKEIIDQTVETLTRHLPGLHVCVEQGQRSADPNADVIVASVQSLVRRKLRFDPGEFGLVIADECHRALAPTWSSVIGYFRDGLPPDGLLVGMTATPRRTDGRSVSGIFAEVAYHISRAELQDLGFLVPVRYFTVRADLHLDRVKKSGGDFQTGSLSAVMAGPPIRALTLSSWQQQARHRKTLVFCAGVEHAELLAADFRAIGVRAAMVSGRSVDRDELVKRFRDGDLQVLTNYGVLTEGFDEPSIGCVLMTRPTTSPLVYNQCIGRGLRPDVGKRDCILIDIVDRSTHQLQYNAGALAGLSRRWNSRGRDPFREKRALTGVSVTDPDAFMRIQQAESLEEVHAILMELPPETVLAGLDGEPVCRYQAPKAAPSPEQGRDACAVLLRQAGAPWRNIEQDPDGLRISLAHPATHNEQYEYLLWHLERVAGRRVCFQEPVRKSRSGRATLRSMLRPGQSLVDITIDRDKKEVRAEIAGLQLGDETWLCDAFHQETGMHLEIGGQLSFGFA